MLKHRAVIGLAFLLAVTFTLSTRAFAQIITTVAGGGSNTGDGGPATSALLLGPNTAFIDAAGNMYIPEFSGGHRVRKVDPAGNISTVAGDGTPGFSGDGGLATSAQLTNPHDVYVNAAGNIYIADMGNHSIRKVDPAGNISTVAGDGTAGSTGDGGLATSARLNNPSSIFVDAAGNLFICEFGNGRVRKVDTAGNISTVASGLSAPSFVHVDAAGNIYVTEFGAHRIRKVDTVGNISTIAGTGTPGSTGDGGVATSATLNNPAGISMDAAGNLYVAEFQGHRIRKIDAAGIITTVAGTGISGFSGDGGPPTNANISSPVGLFVDIQGDIYMGSRNNNRIRKVAEPPPFLVTNTNDSGSGSLRQVILNSNATPGTDTITFDIPGVGPHTIQPTSQLPTVTDPVVVDATSQPGYNGTPLIELDGTNAGAASGLIITAGNSTVKGLAINRFVGVGLYLTINGGNTIESNYIGTDPAGAIDLGNGTGLNVNNSPNNTIGGTDPSKRNLISGNQIGLHVNGAAATGNTVQGNYIGTNAAGTAAIGNFDGVAISTPGTVFGGTTAGAGNLVSGNAHYGLSLGSGVVVEGNLIGTNAAGTAAVGNVLAGVNIANNSNNTIGGTAPGARNIISGNGNGINMGGASATGNVVQGNYIGTDITGTAAVGNGDGVGIQAAATGNTIGGTTAAARNVISGNNSDGLQIFSGATGNTVLGNYIGIDATGASALSNAGSGVHLLGAPGNIIGGTTSGAGNVLSGNGNNGVAIQGVDASGNVVQGNLIGTNASGTAIIGNVFGVAIANESNNIIGGTDPGAGNIISGNTDGGVLLLHASGTGPVNNAIQGNLIYANGGLGIDLRGALTGPDPNDPDDVDTGANNQQNYPVLTGAFSGSIRITGSLDSAPSTIFDLEFFANSACDASGFGEGEIYLGSTTVATDANGDVSFDVTLPLSVALGDYVTATATDPSGNTSEFSQCIQVIEGGIDVSMPDVQSSYATTVQIPVEVTDTSGKGVVSAEVFICYDGDLLTPLSADLTGTLAAVDWSIETNIEDGGQIDTYKIAMATDDAVLVGAGDLLKVNFQVVDVRVPSFSDLVLKHVLFNDGTPTNTAIDGSLTIIGTDGAISALPAQIAPSFPIDVTVTDLDQDLDDQNPDQFGVTVTIRNIGSTITETEVLQVTETGNSTGIFTATIQTVFSLTPNQGDFILQIQAGDQIEFLYDDLLDGSGNGPINRTAFVDVFGGDDGTIAVTLVTQPGDPIYILVDDEDLNDDPLAIETVDVTATNSGDTEVVTLTEVDVDDDRFYGSVPTTSSSGVNGELTTALGEVATISYDDLFNTQGGAVTISADNQIIDPWGDADSNGQLQAFDAAQILLHVLSPHLSPLEVLASNVDDQTVSFGITPFDASLVLQKRVGLISTFPVQDPASENHPQPDPSSPKLIPATRSLSLVLGDGYLSIQADDLGELLAGDLTLAGIKGRVEMGAELSAYLLASRATDDGIRIVFAGAEAVNGSGELLRVYGTSSSEIALTEAIFNNGEVTGMASDLTVQATPQTYVLHPNVPNPFNPETTIRFELPQATEATLEVFDILGQKVRTLVSGSLPAGTHSAVWHGRNDLGAQVSNGVYLYHLQAGEFTQMRRMLLLK